MDGLFNMDLNSGMSFLDKKKSQNDGIYRPSLDLAKDKKKGYKSTIRFLPNFSAKGIGENALEKVLHYVKLPNLPNLNGYYDSMKNFKDERCALTETFWNLKNSDSALEQEKAQLISRSTKYYSYIQVIEDENQPELVGKIMIMAFGHKIKEKINQERVGEINEPCNVYDLAKGKDFVLLVKEVGGFPNYDSSQFKQETSSICLPVEKDGETTMKKLPTEEVNEVLTIPVKYQDKVREYLLERDTELSAYAPVKWDEETRNKVNQIVAHLTNNPVVGANNEINSVASSGDDSFFDDESESEEVSLETASANTVEDEDDFFGE
jgi:hypothetical protein